MKINDLRMLTEAAKPKSPFSNVSLLSPNVETAIELQERKAEVQNIIARLETSLKGNQAELKKIEKQLSKADPQSAEIDIQQIAKQIQNDCGKYLMAIKSAGRLMYRGIGGATMPAFQGVSPTNRNPVDSDPDEVEKFNNILTALKIEANRSNSIFVTSELYHAQDYGIPYVIIPKNSAKFAWSAEEKDMVIDSNIMRDIIKKPISQATLNKEIDKVKNSIKKLSNIPKESKQIDRLYDYLEILELVEDDRIISYSEKLIKTYFPDSPLIPYMEQLTGRAPQYDLKRFQDTFKMKNDSLIAALKMGHEIMIHGEYYAIKHTIWGKFAPILIGKTSK